MLSRLLFASLLVFAASAVAAAPACKDRHAACRAKQQPATLPMPSQANKPAPTSAWGGAYGGVTGGFANTQSATKP